MRSHFYGGFLVMLVCCAVNGQNRGECSRKVKFKVQNQGYALVGHLVTSQDVTDPIDCSLLCLANQRCASFNYKENTSPSLHACELNEKSASTDLIIKSGYQYYDSRNFVLPVCSSSPCKNGGTCFESCEDSGHDCRCLPGFAGLNCETWEGSNGSTSHSPGRSCLQLKSFGYSRGNGRYWIQPTLAKNPFTVYCDMTTDGGGWTLLKKIKLTSTSIPSSHTDTNDYTQITNLPQQTIVTTTGLYGLKTDMGYDQMRFYCHKKAVGRTFHIKTNRDALGYAALRYLVENWNPHPQACSSFTRLPDDTSIVSRNCAKWGYMSGTKRCNKWGHSGYRGSHRTWHRIAFQKQADGTLYTVGFSITTMWCDDAIMSNRRIGDKFMVYVR